MSSRDALQGALNFLSYIAPFILLIFGTLGCLGNFLIFTSKRLRNNTCAFYFLCTAFFELLTICFGLISRIADQYGSLLQKQSRVYCKMRNYFTFVFPTTVSYLLLMATFDRCMSTSRSTRLRNWSQMKVARIVAVLVLLMCMLACSHILVYFDHYPSCSSQPGLYAVFYIGFLIGYGAVVPDVLILLFGCWIIKNIQRARNRVTHVSGVNQPQQIARKTNSQFVVVSKWRLIQSNETMQPMFSFLSDGPFTSSHLDYPRFDPLIVLRLLRLNGESHENVLPIHSRYSHTSDQSCPVVYQLLQIILLEYTGQFSFSFGIHGGMSSSLSAINWKTNGH